MRTLAKRLFQTDPSTFTGAFGMWALVMGIALAGPGEAFGNGPSFNAMQSVYGVENHWGWLMIVDGVSLIASLRMSRVPQRAAISLISAMMWFSMGVSMLVSAWTASGFLSVLGAYSIWCSIQALLAVEQWVYHPPIPGAG